jgi:NADH:ubiquinone oxidoreductase subunit
VIVFLKQFFTWWSGQTLGTRFYTWRKGLKVGEDEAGNGYYQTAGGKRRWVIYNGYAEASAIPPDWHSWIHHVTGTPPVNETYAAPDWQLPHRANPTGTGGAYRPPGSIASGLLPQIPDPGYEAWKPE